MKTKTPAATTFLSQQTPETEKAIAALQRVFDKLSAHAARATYATALSDRLRDNWMHSEKLTQYRGRSCVQKVRGKRCADPRSHCDCTPPGADHVTLWSKDGKPTFYVSQPYHLDMGTIEKMNEFCKEHELTYRIFSQPAFYYPSAVLFIVFYDARD